MSLKPGEVCQCGCQGPRPASELELVLVLLGYTVLLTAALLVWFT